MGRHALRSLTMHFNRFCLIMALGAASMPAAEVRLPGIFGDHMVLQQGRRIPVWGWADAGATISVSLGTDTVTAVTDAGGKWRADLPAAVATAQAQRLTVVGKNTVVFEDVLVGDVWLCSGQSNMEFGVLNITKLVELTNPQIRVFCLTKTASLTPMDDTMRVPKELVWDTSTGYWSTTANAGPWGGFSAVGYLFGQQIQALTGKPVGLIGSHWGGTPIQAWTSLPALDRSPALAAAVKQVRGLSPQQQARYPVVWATYVAAMRKWSAEVWEPDQVILRTWEAATKLAQSNGTPLPPKPQPSGQRPNPPGNENCPTTLFNAMINPLIPYALKGVIWYQGEANVGTHDYSEMLTALIGDWRGRWGQGDFPFLLVQLAGYGPGPTDGTRGRWAALRAEQAKVLALPNTGMAVAIDVGEATDIHPHNKFAVAQRLSLVARKVAYGQEVVASGPMFSAMAVEGENLRLTFTGCGGGLQRAAPPAMPGSAPAPIAAELLGFEIAGADQTWFRATAMIDGSSVVVACDQVAAPVAVRYAWGDIPACNLYNREGLPAVPFRTDAWDAKAAFATPK